MYGFDDDDNDDDDQQEFNMHSKVDRSQLSVIHDSKMKSQSERTKRENR